MIRRDGRVRNARLQNARTRSTRSCVAQESEQAGCRAMLGTELGKATRGECVPPLRTVSEIERRNGCCMKQAPWRMNHATSVVIKSHIRPRAKSFSLGTGQNRTEPFPHSRRRMARGGSYHPTVHRPSRLLFPLFALPAAIAGRIGEPFSSRANRCRTRIANMVMNRFAHVT
jgi:hypothetical protein